MGKIIFTKQQIDDIINKYSVQHIGATKIGKEYNVTKTPILRVLRENNIIISKTNHTYYADYRKFQVIDTPEKAYWLGFIAADGCVFVRDKNSTVRIALSLQDKGHLEKLKIFMDSNVKIKEFVNNTGFSKDHPSQMCSMCFNSIQMANDLIDKNVVPRKSLILQPPNIQKKFFLPYILGYFDGNGSLSKEKKGQKWYFSICGSREITSWISEILELSPTLDQRIKTTPTYTCRCGGTNKPYRVLKQLYDSCHEHLDRKFLLFKNLEQVVLNGNIE